MRRLVDDLPQLRERFLRNMPCGLPGHERLKCLAHHVNIAQGKDIALKPALGLLAAGLARLDERALAVDDRYIAHRLQHAQRLADRRTADAELLAQFIFRGQLFAGISARLLNVASDAFDHLVGG